MGHAEAGGASLRLEAGDDGSHTLAFASAGGDLPAVRWHMPSSVVVDDVVAVGQCLHVRLRPYPLATVGERVPLEVAVQVRLDEGGGGVTLTMDAPADYPIDELSVPGPMRLDGPGASDGWQFLIARGEGLLFAADDEGLPERVTFSEAFSTLPIVALVREPHTAGASLLVFAVGGHDHAVVPLAPAPVPDAGLGLGPGVDLGQLAAAGRWSYARTWRIVWVPEGGLVGLAGVVRAELDAAGFASPALPEKLAAAGVPDRLHGAVGGTHLWWQSGPIPESLVAQLDEAGLSCIVILGRVTPGSDTARRADAAGYVVAPYFQTYDVFPVGSIRELEWRGQYPPEGAHDGWPEHLSRQRDGWLEPGWTHLPCAEPVAYWEDEEFLDATGNAARRPRAVHREVMVQGYHRCPLFHPGVIERHALPMLAGDGYTGIFNDITTAMYGMECYDPAHPCDRRTDIDARRESLAVALGAGKVVFSEQARWWSLDLLHGCEGVLSYGEENMNNVVLADYPMDPSWFDTQLALDLRVPFFGLVARHSVTRTFWWGHGQDRHDETWRAKDALTALFGGNPIYVVDTAHPLEPGTPRWERFVASALAFQNLRRHTFGRPIVDYQVHGRHLGVSVFDGGTTVRANTGPEPADGLEAGAFEILDAHGAYIGGVA